MREIKLCCLEMWMSQRWAPLLDLQDQNIPFHFYVSLKLYTAIFFLLLSASLLCIRAVYFSSSVQEALYFVSLFFRKVCVVRYIFLLISVHIKTMLISYISYKRNIVVCRKLAREERTVYYIYCTMKMYFKNF